MAEPDFTAFVVLFDHRALFDDHYDIESTWLLNEAPLTPGFWDEYIKTARVQDTRLAKQYYTAIVFLHEMLDRWPSIEECRAFELAYRRFHGIRDREAD